jgi:glycosyltransferase involved in cell wall biosynthesis
MVATGGVRSPGSADDPSVAVVIPTRDRLESLKRAVASVQRQAFHEWQLIIVDDASTDGTADWLRALTDPRIAVLVLPSRVERSQARNRGLQAVSAPCVLFLDDDDELVPTALATLTQALRRFPGAVAAVGVRKDTGARQGRRDFHPRRTALLDVRAPTFLGWVAPPSQALFRTSAVREIGGWRPGVSRGEDRLMWLLLSTHGRVVFVPTTVAILEKRPLKIDRRASRRFDFEQWIAYVNELPDVERMRDDRIIRATRSWNDAMEAYDDRRCLHAFGLELGALITAPGAFLSPLTRQKAIGMIGLTALGGIAGRRVLRSIERRVFRGAPA